MKLINYILKYFIVLISVLIIALISCVKKDDNYSGQSAKGSQTDTTGLNPDKNINNFEIDSTILRTDNLGNILGGDMSDWDFNNNNYKEIQEKMDMFVRPYNGEPMPVVGESFYYEIDGDNVILVWFTAREININGFYVERAVSISERSDVKWTEVGFVKGNGNSQEEHKYEFTDKNLKKGNYNYRLKQVSFKDEIEYYNLSYDVIMNDLTMMRQPKLFQFYPEYPNPVVKKLNICFYVPKMEVVSLFFINGKDTVYILDHMQQKKGFYKFSIDKKSLGFENEINRLYIECESCNKKKNFGDIQF